MVKSRKGKKVAIPISNGSPLWDMNRNYKGLIEEQGIIAEWDMNRSIGYCDT
jgi:hypothetical protein